MNFNYSDNEIILLLNEPIKFINEEGQEFFFKAPTLKDIYSNDDIGYLISFLDSDLSEVNKMVNKKVESHYSLINLICSLSSLNDNFKIIANKIMNGLRLLIPDIKYTSILKIGDDIIVTRKLFEKIVKLFFKTLGKEKIIIEDNDDEFTKMEKEAKLRAERIRRKSESKNKIKINNIIISILYEFPQYKIEDLMKMNLYTIYFLFEYVGKIANYEVSKIATGNGLAKKHKYFVDE